MCFAASLEVVVQRWIIPASAGACLLVLVVATSGTYEWARSVTEAEAKLATEIVRSRTERSSMVGWDSELPGGGVVRVEVYRRDYDTDAEWQGAIQDMLKLFPPTQP